MMLKALRLTLISVLSLPYVSPLLYPPSPVTVPPGSCQLTSDWTPCSLLSSESISHDTKLLTFKLPDATRPLNLPTCGCILASGGQDEANGNQPFIRPYTPVSTNEDKGHFTLLVKVYPTGE